MQISSEQQNLISQIVKGELTPYLNIKKRVLIEINELLKIMQRTKSYKPTEAELVIFDLVSVMNKKYKLNLLENYINGLKTPINERELKDLADYHTMLFNEAVLAVVNSRYKNQPDFIVEYEKMRHKKIKDLTTVSNEKSLIVLVASLGITHVAQLFQNAFNIYPLSSTNAGIGITSLSAGALFYFTAKYIAPKYAEHKLNQKLKEEVKSLQDCERYANINIKYFYKQEKNALRLKFKDNRFQLESYTESNFKQVQNETIELSPLEELLLQKN